MHPTRGLLLFQMLVAFDTILAGWEDIEAWCEMKKGDGDPTKPLEGMFRFTQKKGEGPTTITGTISGFNLSETNQKHGFHVHEIGKLGNQCYDSGPHYNPFNTDHGGPTDTVRHVGDLGNVVVNNGITRVNMTNDLIKLSGNTSVIGRTLDVHAGEDDLGKGGDASSISSGNAGSRWACCIITEVKYTEASCIIDEATGDPAQKISGTILFRQEEGTSGNLDIDIDLKGFDKDDQFTEHGFHVHTNGATGNQCKDAGGHYNPESKLHGGPTAQERHVGDLGNVMEDGSGNVKTQITDTVAKLSGANNIIGKSIVVHAKADDLGLGGKVDSNTTGAAGARLGCCIIKAGPPGDVTDGKTTVGPTDAAAISVLNWSLMLLSLLLYVLQQ